MNRDAKIYVAGHRGLAGSAIVRRLEENGYSNLLTRARAELDLADQAATRAFFEAEKPDFVFLAAAKVGGILANDTYPAEFIFLNLAIQTNVIDAAWRSGVKRLLFLGSSCIYPRDCPQPIKEEYLLGGPLEATNRPYAVAKIAGIEACWSYNRQYGTRFVAAMPTNLYGPGDNYDLHNSHVLPALIRKMHEAKQRGDGEVTIWGSGRPKREFLYVDDLGDALVFLMELPTHRFDALFDVRQPPLINIGCGSDLTIADLARVVAGVVGFRGGFRFDTSKADGTPQKLLDTTRLGEAGWCFSTDIVDGVEKTYRDFLDRGQGDRPHFA